MTVGDRSGRESPDSGVGAPSQMARKAQSAGGLPRWARRVASEPLSHFVLVGLALFTAGQIYQSQTNLHRIVITPAHAAQLAKDYALQFGERPAPQALDALI